MVRGGTRQNPVDYEFDDALDDGVVPPVLANELASWSLPLLIDYLNTWERNLAALERGLMVRYEDLRAQPAATLKRIVALIGERFDDAAIEEAVSFGSFDNLRALESKGFFRQGGLTLRNPADPESFKVRRAKVGGYRDYFTGEQVAELEQLVAERLSPSFGYAPGQAPAAAPERVAV